MTSQNALTKGETPTSCALPLATANVDRVWLLQLTAGCGNMPQTTVNCPHLLATSSCFMNCPMSRAIGAGGQMSCPWTLILHRQMARRCLASERAVPLAPIISSVTNSYQGTSSSEMPWTTNCNQRVVCQVGWTVSSISSSSPMSMQYTVCCPGLPLEHSSLPSPEDRWPSSSCHITWTGVC